MSRTTSIAPIERLVVHAAREIQLLGVLTPANAPHERIRLVDALRAGRAASPRWTYAAVAHDELRRLLDAAEHALAAARAAPLAGLYLERIRELDLEAALCAAAGTSALAPLALRRFAPMNREVTHDAAAICATWLDEPVAPPRGEALPSDDPDPRSLLSQMRAAVGRLRLPFRVVATHALAPLAATGHDVILVACGRLVREDDVRRTVLHETEGHALPRARALSAPLELFRAGTARGIDDQEGRALLIEERAGMLEAGRRRQLAARHRAVQAMLDGASFADVASMLVRSHGLDPTDAVVIAERAFRGSDGTTPGLGRERIYLESFVRVRARLAARPGDERILAAGQIAVDALDALRPFVPAA